MPQTVTLTENSGRGFADRSDCFCRWLTTTASLMSRDTLPPPSLALMFSLCRLLLVYSLPPVVHCLNALYGVSNIAWKMARSISLVGGECACLFGSANHECQWVNGK